MEDKTQEELRAEMKVRQQWFIDRVGKRVFRDSLHCKCTNCERVAKKGLIVQDKNHAIYLCDCAGEMGYKYRDEK